MPKHHRFRTTYLVLLLIAIILPALYLGTLSLAQSTRSFEEKAGVELKRVYQAYRQQARATQSATREREREVLRQRVALEERAGNFTVGVLLRLREEGVGAQSEIEASGFQLRARIGNVAAATVLVDELPRLAEINSVQELHAAGFDHLDAISYEPMAVG